MSNGAREFIESQAGQHLVNTLAHHLDESKKRVECAVHLAFLNEDTGRGLTKLEVGPGTVHEVMQMTGKMTLTEMAEEFSRRNGTKPMVALQEMARRNPDIEPATIDEAQLLLEVREGLDPMKAREKAVELYPRLQEVAEHGRPEDRHVQDTRWNRAACKLSMDYDLDISAAQALATFAYPELLASHDAGETRAQVNEPETDLFAFEHFQRGGPAPANTPVLPVMRKREATFQANAVVSSVMAELRAMGVEWPKINPIEMELPKLVAAALAKDGFDDRLASDSELLREAVKKCSGWVKHPDSPASLDENKVHAALALFKKHIRRNVLGEKEKGVAV